MHLATLSVPGEAVLSPASGRGSADVVEDVVGSVVGDVDSGHGADQGAAATVEDPAATVGAGGVPGDGAAAEGQRAVVEDAPETIAVGDDQRVQRDGSAVADVEHQGRATAVEGGGLVAAVALPSDRQVLGDGGGAGAGPLTK